MPDFFDRLLDEIVSSPPGNLAGSDAALSAPTRRRRSGRLRFIRPRRLLAGLALLAVPGTVGGLALAGTFSGQQTDPQLWVNGQRVAPEAGIATAQSAHFAILRRPRTAADALLPWTAYTITHTPIAANGVNPALSRRALGFQNGAAWVVPGNGTICLVTVNGDGLTQATEAMAPGDTSPKTRTRIPGANGVTGCTEVTIEGKGWLAGTGGTAERPGFIFTAGMVPDGVDSVTVRIAEGGIVLLPVHENVFMAEVKGWPSTVSFTGPDGPVILDSGPNVLAHLHGAAANRTKKH